MKTLYIVQEKYINKAAQEIQKLKSQGFCPVVLVLDEISEKNLIKANITPKSILNYTKRATEEYYEYKIAADLIRNWGGIIVERNIALKDFLSYRNVSLWDSHQVEFQLYFISKIIKQVEIARNIIEIEQPERIIIAADFNNAVELKGIRFDRFLLKSLLEIGKLKTIEVIYLGRPNNNVSDFLVFFKPYLALGRDILWKIKLSLKSNKKKIKAPCSKARVMFLNHTARNADAIIPIMRRMIKDKTREMLVVQIGPDGEEKLKRENILYQRFEKYLSPFLAVKIFLATQRLAKKWIFFNTLVKERGNFAIKFFYQDINLWDAGNEIFKSYWSLLARAVRNIELANSIIEKEMPSIIIGTNERSGNYRVFYELARMRKIPYLSLQYGLIRSHPLWSVPIAADIMAVEGKWVIDCIGRAGIDTHKLVITGQPKYDVLLDEYSRISKDAVFAKYGLDSQKKLLLYTSHTLGEEQSGSIKYSLSDELSKYNEEIFAIYQAVSRMNDAQLVVKPHPDNERINLHRDVFKKVASPNIHMASSNSDVNELIATCDVLITRHSTTGLDALILGKRLVIVNLTGRIDPIPYVEYGAALGAYSPEDVFPVISKAYKGEMDSKLAVGRDKFIADFAYKNDNQASKRVIDLVDKLLSEKL